MVLMQIDGMGRGEILQQKRGLSCFHHLKADIDILAEALRDQALVLVGVEHDATDVLAINQLCKVTARNKAALPHRPIFQAGLIPLASINRAEPNPLLTDADRIAVDHASAAGILGCNKRSADEQGG